MVKTITISNLKSIETLEFRLPSPGVHLLSGSNGSGKTTLLACLLRIGQSNAFQLHFATSQHSANLDSFAAATIAYRVDDRVVTYVYAGERWVPRPRRSSNLITDFGYPDVRYVGATAARITPRNEDFRPARMNAAALAIRDTANKIFETDRFTHLKTINLTTGNRNQAFVLAPLGGLRPRYISERNFSLGELCILKLLRELTTCRNGSLVLIDELELALHPRAQIGLFNYLEQVARDKSLTVIVSTHSVTLLKVSPRQGIIFLEKREGTTAVLYGCFPAYSLGSLSFAEERLPDVVIYVEDEAARSVVDSMIKLAIAARYNGSSDVFPTTRVVPVGDFKSVLRFYDRNRAMLPEQVKQWILLDQDVEAESLEIMASSSNNPMRGVFHKHSSAIRYLPWTPELGLIKFLSAERVSTQQGLRSHFGNAYLNLPPAMLKLRDGRTSQADRAESKALVRQLCAHLCEQGTVKEDVIRDRLYTMFAEFYFNCDRAAAMQLLGPIIS